jgi:N-acetylglutamate synthase-like GNAT family acetyltransferase
MSIRRAKADDVQAVLFVINKSNSEAYKKIIPPKYFKEPVLTPDELLEEFKKMTFYAYRMEEVTIGVAALTLIEDNVGQIRWVYILPEHQRKGIGTALMNYVEKEATKMKLQRLKLLTSDKACWAKNFYSKLGYTMVDKVQQPWGDDAVFEKTLVRRE